MRESIKLFNSISRTHSYWGRNPLTGLLEIFKDVKEGDVVVNPFCGGGTPVLAALLQGARVIAGDLNPMAVFLTKVLIRPISISALLRAFYADDP